MKRKPRGLIQGSDWNEASRRWRGRVRTARGSVERMEPRRLLSLSYAAVDLTAALGAEFPRGVSIAGLNDSGDLIGIGSPSSGLSQGFVYHGGAVIPLGGVPGWTGLVKPIGINDSLEIVAEQLGGGGGVFVANYSPDPAPHWSDTPLAADSASTPNVAAYAINSAGTVAGWLDGPGYWDATGTFHPLDASFTPAAINDSGTLAGADGTAPFAATWDGSTHDLGTLGGFSSHANAINRGGMVAGGAQTTIVDPEGNRVDHPFLYSDGVLHDLGSLGFDADFGNALGLNDQGTVVGNSPVAWNDSHAFVYDGAMHDLNGLTANLPAGWAMTNAIAINNPGQIVARAQSANTSRWFLLNLTEQQHISGSVWLDTNHNGIRDASESGLAGVTVFVDANNNGALDSGETAVTTDAQGRYAFSGAFQPGSYTVRQVLPLGDAATAPIGYAGTVVLGASQSAAGPDFGDVPLSTVPMDFNYLLTIAQHYGQQGTFATGDLNDDGQVDFNDLLLLAQNYGHPLAAAGTGPANPSAAAASSVWHSKIARTRIVR